MLHHGLRHPAPLLQEENAASLENLGEILRGIKFPFCLVRRYLLAQYPDVLVHRSVEAAPLLLSLVL